jgi:hypothetical protein
MQLVYNTVVLNGQKNIREYLSAMDGELSKAVKRQLRETGLRGPREGPAGAAREPWQAVRSLAQK